MKPFTVPGLLRAAASYIEIHGHEQRRSDGGAKNRGGPCCPIVAIMRLGPHLLRGAINAMNMRYVGDWSDRTPTAEVLATMRRVARELDARQ